MKRDGGAYVRGYGERCVEGCVEGCVEEYAESYAKGN